MAIPATEEIVRRWAERGAAAGDTVKRGVQSVTESPTEKAALAADKWATNVANAKDKFQKNLRKVSLSQWKAAMAGKGVNNMVAGYGDAMNKQKFKNFLDAFIPYLKSGIEQVKQMPKANLQDGINRAVFMIRWNADWKNRGGGGGDF